MRCYRGKRKNTGEWVYGYFCMFGESAQIFVPFTEEQKEENKGHFLEKASGMWYEVNPATVGQETGIPDKNGKMIFEGDCINHPLNIVEFLDGTFCVNGDRPLYWMAEHGEVIGNRHDNPELLEIEEEDQ